MVRVDYDDRDWVGSLMSVAAVNWVETRLLVWGGYTSNHVQTPAGRVHYFDYRGDGVLPPLVVLHGINSSASAFRAFLLHIRPHFSRILAPDFLGHGNSASPSEGLDQQNLRVGLDAVLRQVAPSRFLLYGNSLGGLGAVRYAAEYSDRVQGLMLCSPGGAPQDSAALATFLSNFRMHTNADALAFLDKLFARRPWYARLIAPGLRRHASRTAVMSLVDGIRPDMLLDPSELAGLPMPVHLLWGKADTLMPRDQYAFYRANLPEGHHVIEPDAMGHVPHIDTPGELAELVVSFGEQFA